MNDVKEEGYMIKKVIVAPHPDDEIIGCFSILKDAPKQVTSSNDTFNQHGGDNDGVAIIYTSVDAISNERREEALKLKDNCSKVKIQFFNKSIPPIFLNKDITLYFPDSLYEYHPDHRHYGAIGEEYARNGLDVVFYSINMKARYIRSLSNDDSAAKEELFKKVYSSQGDLIKYEKKYMLFEGMCKWLF